MNELLYNEIKLAAPKQLAEAEARSGTDQTKLTFTYGNTVTQKEIFTSEDGAMQTRWTVFVKLIPEYVTFHSLGHVGHDARQATT